MEQTEVLIVEAKQYELNGYKVIIPTLFGYTEEARMAKRAGASLGGQRRRREFGFSFQMGTGTKRGSINVKTLSICPRSLFTLWTDGTLDLNFGWLDGSDTAVTFRDRFYKAVKGGFAWEVPEDYVKKFVHIPPEEWTPQANEFIELVRKLVEEISVGTTNFSD